MKPSERLPLPDIFYAGGKTGYFIPSQNGTWIDANESTVKRLLRREGYSPEISEDARLSEVEAALLRIQEEQNVAYAGPLAGYQAGLFEMGGNRILVTKSVRLIQPAQGRWDVVQEIFRSLFGQEQLPYFYGWLQRGLQQLHREVWLPGQVLVLAGPPDGGKSLTQSIITEVLGGRVARPYLFMSGRTTFNADLLEAEHLVIEDEANSTDIRSRIAFGSAIKNFAVTRDQASHGKFKEQLVLRPRWRVSISLNPETERIYVLPPLHEDIQDKVMLFKVGVANLTMPNESPEDKLTFWEHLKMEVPGFVYYLLNDFVLPEELRSVRYGVKHYHHPELVRTLHEISPEYAFLILIDETLFAAKVGPAWEPFQPFEGTAEELENRLRGVDAIRRRVENILTFNAACGTYLGRLRKKFPERVSARMLHGQTVWTIQPPPQQQDPMEGGDR